MSLAAAAFDLTRTRVRLESYGSSAAQAAVDTVSLADKDVGPLPVPSWSHLGTNTSRGKWLPDASDEAIGYGTNTSNGRWVPTEAFQQASSVAEANALAETASADAQAGPAPPPYPYPHAYP